MKLWHFILHLRLHYQFFILSGGYLLAGLLVPEPEWRQYGLQFLNVHILLFGGATAFNSYWDRDEGPVGGLRNPPPMERWMRDVSLLMQFAGFLWASTLGISYGGIYAVSLLLFWLYSTPLARWKGKPLLSLVAIGVSTGTNSLFLGALAAGASWSPELAGAALGTALVLLSLYPVSQIFQLDADRKRDDETFALRYGISGVRHFFTVAFPAGVILIGTALFSAQSLLAVVFASIGLAVWGVLSLRIYRLRGEEREYGTVMKIKYAASVAFVSFIIAALLTKHSETGINWLNRLLF